MTERVAHEHMWQLQKEVMICLHVQKEGRGDKSVWENTEQQVKENKKQCRENSHVGKSSAGCFPEWKLEQTFSFICCTFYLLRHHAA